MRKIVTIWRCCKCGREYKGEHQSAPKQCKTRDCKGNIVKMTVIREC